MKEKLKKFLEKLEKKKLKIFGFFAIILIIFFAISLSPRTLQNDTFYTVTIGKTIMENGIDMQDHFSWHGLPYVYPHWLYDVGMYSIYNLGGWNGIYISTCVLASILGISIYFANVRLTKKRVLSFLVTIAVLYLMKGYIAARAQLVTFILFILQVYNIEKFIEKRKIKNAVTLLAIHTLIANLHVAVWPFSFILYLPYVVEYLVAEFSDIVLYQKPRIIWLKLRCKDINKKLNSKKIKENKKEKLEVKLQKFNNIIETIQSKNERIKVKREEKKPYKIKIEKNKNVRWLLIIIIIAAFTGLLTPLGKTPYTYTYDTMIGNTMKNINEHLPLTLINNTPMICTLVVLIVFMAFTDAKIKLSDLLMISGLCFMMFHSRRQQSIFVLIGSIAFTRMVVDIIQNNFIKTKEDEMDKKLINKFTFFLIVSLTIILSLHMYSKVKDNDFINKRTYPVEASEWILNNLDLDKIKMYNEYNYGSYLLYKGIPVFIDSRADLYAPEFNTPTGRITDGKDIFMDFINTSNIGTYYGDTFKKYGITHVLVYKNAKVSMLIKKTDYEKYKEIYSDNSFIIYEVLDY